MTERPPRAARRFRVKITTLEVGSHVTTVRAPSAADAVVMVLRRLWLFDEPHPEPFALFVTPEAARHGR